MKEHVHIRSEYKASTNLSFDTDLSALVNGFVPTKSSLDVIEWLFQPAINPSASIKRSHLLTGSYGKGKSYSVLIALSILNSSFPEKEFLTMINKIAPQRKYLSDWIEDYYKTKNRLLPVIVNGGFSSLSLSLSSALSESLKLNGLEDIIIDSSFSRAINSLNIWKKDYPEAYERFFQLIKREENVFMNKLLSHDETALHEFAMHYPAVTNGSEFVQISDMQVSKDYKKVAAQLDSKGYRGLFVIYDEFSKFLEGKKGSMSEADIKLLQELAEISNVSNEYGQVHLLLVSHKNPTNYFSDETTMHEWDAISGRFDIKELFGEENQEYEIIKNILDVDPSYIKNWKSTNLLGFDNLMNQCKRRGIFNEKEFLTLASVCFPLHPLVTYCLPRLSERIAQNERSLFSFLLAKEKGSLSDTLEHKDDEELIRVSSLFDYFQPLFRKSSYNGILFQLEVMVRTIQSRLEGKNDIAIDIAKTIAILIALNDSDHLPPTIESVQLCYSLARDKDYLSSSINEGIESLMEYGVLKVSGLSGTFLPMAINPTLYNDVSLRKKRKKPKFSLPWALQGQGFRKAFYPVQYNDKHSITRYFLVKLFDANELLKGDCKLISDAYKEGIGTAFFIIGGDDKYAKVVEYIEKQRLVPLSFVMLTKPGFPYDKVVDCSLELNVVSEMLANKNLRPDDEQVLKVLHQDAKNSLQLYLDCISNPSNKNSEIYYNNKQFDISNNEDFIGWISNLFEEVFPYTPLIIRDDLNVDLLSKPALKSRDELVRYILTNDYENIHNLKLTSQTHSFYRSSCLKNQIIFEDNEDKKLVVSISNSESNCKKPLEIINQFFLSSAEEEKSLDLLIPLLRGSEGHIGLKKGPLAIFFACICAMYPQNLVFKRNRKESPLSSQLITAIIEHPEEFSVSMEKWDISKQRYLELLCNHYGVDKLNSESMELLASAIVAWWNSLPLQVRTSSGLWSSKKGFLPHPKETQKLLKVIGSYDGNSFAFIMEKIPNAFGKNQVISENLANVIIQTIIKLSEMLVLNQLELKQHILDVLDIHEENNNFIKGMHKWVDSISDELEFQSSIQSRRLIQLLRNSTVTEDSLFRSICISLAGIRFSDWSEETYGNFTNVLKNIHDDVSKSISEKKICVGTDSAQVKLTDRNGKDLIFKIEIAESKELYDMIYNEIDSVLNDYESSLSRAERNKILLDLILNL
jgi:hypothetical protein